MKQVIIIHGGESFSSYERYISSLDALQIDYERLKPAQNWKRWLASELLDTDVLLPQFPNSANAVYNEWKMYFEKLSPFFSDDVRLVGHSLGAMFLTKYLHENPLPQKIDQLILISAGYDDSSREDLGSFAVESAEHLERSANEIHLFHSKDDPVVAFSELAKFQANLPHAISHIFKTRGHFNHETFPELLELLQNEERSNC